MDLDDTALTTILTGTDQEAATALVRAKESPMDPRCFIVGRTGVGKSAARQHLEATKPDRVIRISPEDLSLPYITDLGVFRYLDSLDVHLDLLFIALWKHVLLVELPAPLQGEQPRGEAAVHVQLARKDPTRSGGAGCPSR